ncbi:MAG: GIY-YIG nuclease family protein [Rhodospirillales bacterium]
MSPHPCFVYVLGTVGQTVPGDIRTYVGWSNDIAARLSKHNAGDGAKSTRGRQWQLLYAELFFTRGDAMSREWYLKRDRKFRKALAKNWSN